MNRERCIESLIRIGVDFPNYPQLTEMGKQFLDDLAEQRCGVIKKNGKYRLEDHIEKPSKPPGLEPYKWTLNYLEEKGLLGKVKLKASITGPFTLASYLKIKDKLGFPFDTAISEAEYVSELAEIISESCRAISSGASMVSIDEPILTIILGRRTLFDYDEEFIIDIFNLLKASCGDTVVGTHICGRLSPKLSETLLRTKLDFLSHEFFDSPENFEIYNPEDIISSGKILSVGCVSSRNPRIESVDEILNVMYKAERFGRNLIFTPDCGFKNLIVNGSRELGFAASIAKLERLIEAARIFRKKQR